MPRQRGAPVGLPWTTASTCGSSGSQGGQRQRLSVACALVGAPELLFLDEPTANVDPIARRRMRTVLREAVSKGAAMVYTSHDLNEVGDLCDRVVVLARGRVVAKGTPGELEERSGLQTLEVRTDELVAVGELDLPEVVGADLDGDALLLVSRDAAHTSDAVRRVAPDARLTVRSESFEDLYVRMVTQAEERSVES
ncbi:ATP-binding cassette domain-containing protein [Actinomyces timonensis]|uniref:ATP-binding cassette domain-containing protein n=1 Tax=Actinomyces timonensis TaxID=1288391 RepID=A0AAU8N395_9ACTO